jgi:thioredoxin reductase (NADPH)
VTPDGGSSGVFVLDCDRKSLDAFLSDLSGRFGDDFTVGGETSPADALVTLQHMVAADMQVALLLVDDPVSELLSLAHVLYPRAARVLLIDRDYSATSPVVQAIALGHADYHIVRPWTDDEMMYRAMSEYLAAWETGAADKLRVVPNRSIQGAAR